MISPELQTVPNNQMTEDACRALSDTHIEGALGGRVLTWTGRFLLAYFAIRLVFFAVCIAPFVPPDEVTHAGLCTVFSKVFWFPVNTPESFQFGLVTNIPWLYYWIMGKLLHLNAFGMPDLVFLRLLNIPLAFGTVFFIRRTLLLLTDKKITDLLLIAVLTNTPMFSLLSASVSYDNLTNLLAAMSFYYLLTFLKERSGKLFAIAILCQLLGSLTKITFLPLILALDVVLLLHEWKNLLKCPAALKNEFQSARFRALWLVVPILIVLGLNLQLYAGNYLNYGSLSPSMSNILSPAIGMNYRLEARSNIFNEFKQGHISYMEALQLTGTIQHPGDKSDTFYLLMNYQKMKNHPELWMGPVRYAKYWFQTVVATILGIKAHLLMIKPSGLLLPFYLLLALSCIGFLVRWRPRQDGWLPADLVFIAAAYASYLMIEVNYDSYLNYGTPGLTLQGRYLLPILGSVYVLCCHYLLQLFRQERIGMTLAVLTAILFIGCDFPWFLTHATPQWYAR